MITGEEIQNCEDEKQGVKLVVVDTMQFFEFEIPAGQDPDDFINSDECRQECAARILNQTTDLNVDRVYTEYDSVNQEWIESI